MVKVILAFLFLINLNLSWCQPLFKILVFTKTAGFQHTSIPDGIAAITQLGQQNNFDVDQTDDASAFTVTNLGQYAAVVFLNTTGDVLNSIQETAFEQYIQAGGGFVGVHSATDTEYNWPWYGSLVGSYFVSHPAVQTANLIIEDATHSSTIGLPDPWVRTDEWYNFSVQFPANLNVLISIDETSYTGGTMGSFHPVSWYHYYDGGRSFYTAIGHTSATFSEPEFRQHLLGGILWAANQSTSVSNININNSDFKLPSPAKDFIPVDINFATSPLIVKMFNLQGQIVMTEQFYKKIILNIGELNSGVYLILIDGENFEYRQKIVISK